MRHVLPAIQPLGGKMWNKELAKAYNRGEITLLEYLRLAQEQEQKHRNRWVTKHIDGIKGRMIYETKTDRQ